KVLTIEQPETFSLKPSDFKGLGRAKMAVKEGDNVKAGTPLFFDRNVEDVLYTAPVSGEIVEIKRGEKRKILEVKILADKKIEYKQFSKFDQNQIAGLNRDVIIDQLQKSGAWVNVIQRPYGIVADASTTPKSIFISAFDKSPLAPDYEFLLEGKEDDFKFGLAILKSLTDGSVHVGINGDKSSSMFLNGLQIAQVTSFTGPHPSGNVGVHIHHLDPISKGDIVWTIDPIGVALIGKLFAEGIYDTSRRIAITGSEVLQPQFIETYAGAPLAKLLENNISEKNNRIISGNVLTGEGVGLDGYLGYYHRQVTVIPEGKEEEFLGWIKPTFDKPSFHKAFGMLSFLKKEKPFEVSTNTNGEERNFVVSGSFEDVMPMDILPTYLFKAILSEDYDDMEGLGIYEVIEEDVALCEFIDVSKNPIQEIVREGIDLIKEG
ncbi:MAG: Na(+)-translocating NADH-quinone reductase subunit A, partial [Bacteroidota bacterium]